MRAGTTRGARRESRDEREQRRANQASGFDLELLLHPVLPVLTRLGAIGPHGATTIVLAIFMVLILG